LCVVLFREKVAAMFTTVLPVWGVALLLTTSCWSIGSTLVASKSPLVGMLAGWCLFLLLCAVPWIAGLSASAVRPLFWAFFIAGIWLTVRHRRWPELVCAVAGTGLLTGLFATPFLRFPGLLAYGAHGLDMWGYVITADWLQLHSFRTFPEIGLSPMRFNWTWYVLHVCDRPLNYESLACLGAATGLTPAQAYLAYPILLLSSLGMALARQPWVFRFKYWWLALLITGAVVFHPILVLPWIAGFFGGTIVAGYAAMAFAAAAVPEEGEARHEALALAVLMMVFCGGLYSLKFLYVALALGGVPLFISTVIMMLRHDFSPLRAFRPGRGLTGILAAIVIMTAALLILGKNQAVNSGLPQSPVTAAGHFLGIFGGSSPFVWLGYIASEPFDRDPWFNPVGVGALGGMILLFGLVSWTRWKQSRDYRVPLLVGLCVGAVWMVSDDELIMAKTLAIFGFTLLILLAAVSSQLRHWTLGVLAAAVCCLPCLRSAEQMQDMIWGPYITCTEDNIADFLDGQDWRVLGYLHFQEDKTGFNWANNPRTFSSVTHFLPKSLKRRLAEKYHLPPP
jgi:hypothetical protein